MFDHIGINVKDVAASKEFYTTLLSSLGYRVKFELPEHQVYGFGSYKPSFWLAPGRDETRHSGPIHIAFAAKNRQQVDAFYKAGLKAGGKDNGPPGVRTQYHRFYYGAFIVDLDGHNVECVCHWPPALLWLTSWPAIIGAVGIYPYHELLTEQASSLEGCINIPAGSNMYNSLLMDISFPSMYATDLFTSSVLVGELIHICLIEFFLVSGRSCPPSTSAHHRHLYLPETDITSTFAKFDLVQIQIQHGSRFLLLFGRSLRTN
jgi:predicted lactoylglutathione lyase